MPSYAPYGNAIYGETSYGAPPAVHVQTTMSVSPDTTAGHIGDPSLYSSLFISWVIPGGNWNQLILVRSAYGVPISPFYSDGVQLFDITANPLNNVATPQYPTSYLDTGLKTGRFYYYGLFVYDTDVSQWLLASSAQGLCLTDYQFPTSFASWTPDWYMEQDLLLEPPQPLQRFFDLLGFELNWIRSEIETLYTLNSTEYISGDMLPWLGGNVGIGYEPALGMQRSRDLVSNAVNLYKYKGTADGIEAAASAYTGYGCEVTISQNLEIQLDDAAWNNNPDPATFNYAGHWLPANAGTTCATVEAVTVYSTNPPSGITPQHASYLPIVGNTGVATGLLQQADAQGYLPALSENLCLVEASSAFGFTQQTQGIAIPPALFGAAMAYNPVSGTTVLFGGSTDSYSPGSYEPGDATNQTWVFNGTYWANLTPASGNPTARSSHAMAYDSATGTIIMFGGVNGSGVYQKDTWSWNGAAWSEVATTGPDARVCHAMGQMSSTGVVLFGGYDGSNVKNDTWLWSSGAWHSQSPATSPSARYAHTMAYDSFEQATPNVGSGKIFLFGGLSTTNTILSDTWWYNGTTWANPSTVTTPAARYNATLVYDPTTDNITLFGGATSIPYPSTTTATIYQWTGTNWRLESPASAPASRWGHVMAADSTGTLLMFGGHSLSTGMLSDSWLYTPAAGSGAGSTAIWSQIEGGQTPQPREGAAITYDTATGDVLMWGGQDSTVYYNSTWQWNNTTGWKQLTPATSPPAAIGAAMAYTTGGNVIMFGGATSGGFLSETWTWNGTNWSGATPSPSPQASAYGSMVYDSTLTKIIYFGGETNAGAQGTTWYYTGGTWALQTPSGTPANRYFAGMVYTSGGLSTLFGGTAGSGPVDDVTYQYNSNTTAWSVVSVTNPPPARYGFSMVYDSSLTASFIFGGQGSGLTIYTDSWELSGTTWAQVNFGTPSPLTSGRTLSAAAYNTSANNIVFFGGNTNGGEGVLGDTWTGTAASFGAYITECNATNATALGIPVNETATPQTVVVSGYVSPVVSTSLQYFYMQVDWYDINGSFLSSSPGVPELEVYGAWTRIYSVATAPTSARYFGRSMLSSSQVFSGDGGHLFDAVQSEFNTLASPGPTAWTPPRDIWLNFFPQQRNLVLNGQGKDGTTYWTNVTAVSSGPPSGTWPQETVSGFSSVSSGATDTIQTNNYMPINAQVGNNVYSASMFIQGLSLSVIAQWTLEVIWYTSAHVQISTNSVTVTSIPDVWVQLSIVNMTAPTNAFYAQMVLKSTDLPASPNSTWYMAAPYLGPGSSTQYFDGTFVTTNLDYTFEGGANTSISDYYPNLLSRMSRLITVMPDYIPIGSTFSIYMGQQAYTNAGMH